MYSQLTGPPLFYGLVNASALAILAQTLGPISGGYFNPAVTFALRRVKCLNGHGMEWRQVWTFWLAQVLGATCGAGLANISLGKGLPIGNFLKRGFLGIGLSEFFYTFMMCFVVLNMTAPKRNEKERMENGAMALGLCLLAGAYGAGNLTGNTTFNPAIAVAMDVTTMSFTGLFGFGPLLWLVQLPAAALAANVYSKVRPEEFEEPASEGRVRELLISEFVGSLMVVLTACLNFHLGILIGPLSVGAAMASMIFAIGDASGGHFNPAISCASALAGVPGRHGLHVIASIVGSLIASCMTFMILPRQRSFGPKLPFTLAQASLSEGMFTFLLCFVFLAVAISKKTKASQFSGLAVGSCVSAGGFAIGSISGAALNPVVALGLAATGGGLPHAAAYTAVHVMAASLAAASFKVTHAADSALK